MSHLGLPFNGAVEDVTSNGSSDYLIKVTEYVKGSHLSINRTRTFKTSIEVMSDWLSGYPPSKTFKDASGRGFDGFTVEGVRLLLRIMHGTVINEQYLLSKEEVFDSLAFAERYHLPCEKMQNWYNTWFNTTFPDWSVITLADHKLLLFPSYTIKHYKIFAYVTMRLSYLATGFISEINPSRYEELRTPSRILDQINAARSSMRIDLNQGLFDVSKPSMFCPRKCSKATECFWQYMEEVTATPFWPFATQHRIAIQTLLRSIAVTKWTKRSVTGSCKTCYDWLQGGHVQKIRKETEGYWKGMCLDCMELSTDAARSHYSEYFHKDHDDEHGIGCTADPKTKKVHDRNEWYHSFMGPQEVMVEHLEAKESKFKARVAKAAKAFSANGV